MRSARPWKLAVVLAAVSALFLFGPVFADGDDGGEVGTLPPGPGLTNGGFEAGNFSGWSVVDAGSGGWFAYSGTTSPFSGFQIAAPPEGTFAATTDQVGPGSHILYQDFVVPSQGAELSFILYYQNRAGVFYTPASLNHSGVGPNQQYRVDIMDPSAAVNSVAASDVLATIFHTQVGDPAGMAPTLITSDLTPFAGVSVRLRFAEVDNLSFFQASVDDVKLVESLEPPVPPEVEAGPNQVVDEGTLLNIVASFTDPNEFETHTAVIDWGDDSATAGTVDQDLHTVSGSHTYLDEGEGLFTVTVTVTDSRDFSGFDTFVVTVNNAAPVVEAGPDQHINGRPQRVIGEFRVLNLEASFADAGVMDTHTAFISWGDGRGEPGVVNESEGSGTVSGSHVYRRTGRFVVTVRVTDNDGATGRDSFEVTVSDRASGPSQGAPAAQPSATVVEVDEGVWVSLPGPSGEALGAQGADLTGTSIGIDLSHNAAGRQGLVVTGYSTIQGDLISRGATLTFEDTGPFTLPLLSKHDAWWIEEDFGSAFSEAEKDALVGYVSGGGCLFFNGDEHGIFTGDPGGVIALFGIPYANVSGSSGLTSDISPHFITEGVTTVSLPSPTNSLAPVPPAQDVVRDVGGHKMIAVLELGGGRVIVFSEELSLNGTISSGDNRLLANNVFDWCSGGRVAIDILPGISSNLVLPGSPGFLPVAVLGSPDFSAASIDPSTVAFGPNGAPVARRSGLVDVNGDGFRDMVFTFRTFLTGVRCGDTEASLTGLTKEGQRFIGADQIITAGCGFFRLPVAASSAASSGSDGESSSGGSQGGADQPAAPPVEEIFQPIGTGPSGGGQEQPAPRSRDIWSGDAWSSDGPRRPIGRDGSGTRR